LAARPHLTLVLLVAFAALLAVAPGIRPARAEDKWEKHWHDRVAAFARENAALAADRKSAVFVGDSITEGFPLEKHFAGKPVLNRGIVADRIGNVGERGVLRRLDESVFDCRPAVVFILIGVNDLAASPRPPELYVEGFATLVDRIRERLPKVKVVVQTCLPVGRKYGRHATLNPRIVAYNEGLRALAKARGLTLVDLHKLYRDAEGFLPDDLSNDGLHLKREGFAKWAEAVRPLIP